MKRVYFMRRRDGEGPVKIGCSDAPDKRLRVVADWSPYVLELAAVAPGTFADERALHLRFAENRLHGEWFTPSAELSALIAQVAVNGVLPERFTDQRTQIAVQRYEAGETLQSIADDMDITRERVRQIIRKAGCASQGWRDQHKRRPRSVAAQREAEVIRLYEAGASYHEIAAAIGDYPWNVQNALRRAGKIVRRKGGPRPKPETEQKHRELVLLYQQGLKTAEIAARTGCCQPEVYRALQRFGLSASRNHRRSPVQARAA